jgi:glyoxylase-like metal-dependent hydrolase (beta-lactamase superfamily II)
MTMEKIRANIFVETVYPGVNVGCVVTDEGAICIDTPLLPGEAQRWMARIRSLGAEPVRFVVYTSGQSERVLGTQYFICNQQTAHPPRHPVQRPPRSRRVPFARQLSPVDPGPGRQVRTGAVVSHAAAWDQVNEHRSDSFKQSMLDGFGERDPDMINLEVILPQITCKERIDLFVGELTATLLVAAKGVLWVWLPEQRVHFAGDTVVVGTHPPLALIDLREWLAALEWLCQEPKFRDAVIVPGRGPLCDTSATEPLTEYLRLACERTQQVYRAGRPKAELNEVAAELLPLYPVIDGQRERVQRQIKLALDDLYDEFTAEDAVSE